MTRFKVWVSLSSVTHVGPTQASGANGGFTAGSTNFSSAATVKYWLFMAITSRLHYPDTSTYPSLSLHAGSKHKYALPAEGEKCNFLFLSQASCFIRCTLPDRHTAHKTKRVVKRYRAYPVQWQNRTWTCGYAMCWTTEGRIDPSCSAICCI